MKTSIETKVAVAVASGFLALVIGVMGQGRSGGQTGGPQGYGPTNNPGLNQMSPQGYNSSLPGRTNAEQNRTKFSNETEEATTPKKAKKSKHVKTTKQRSERAREKESTSPSQPEE